MLGALSSLPTINSQDVRIAISTLTRRRLIANTLKAALTNRMKEISGLANEKKFSSEFHEQGIPLLVSPMLLRSRDLGQIDLARIIKPRDEWVVEIAEVKSSLMGEAQMQKSQKRRLFSSQHFLAMLFGHRTKLVSMVKNNR